MSLRQRIESLECELTQTKKAGVELKNRCYTVSDRETDNKRITTEQEQVCLLA